MLRSTVSTVRYTSSSSRQAFGPAPVRRLGVCCNAKNKNQSGGKNDRSGSNPSPGPAPGTPPKAPEDTKAVKRMTNITYEDQTAAAAAAIVDSPAADAAADPNYTDPAPVPRTVDQAADATSEAVADAASTAQDAVEVVTDAVQDGAEAASEAAVEVLGDAADAAADGIDQASEAVAETVNVVGEQLAGANAMVGETVQRAQDAAEATADRNRAPQRPPATAAALKTAGSSFSSLSSPSAGNGNRAAVAAGTPTPGVGGSSSSTTSGGSSSKHEQAAAARLEKIKMALLVAVSSLDRGLAANAQEAADVDSLVRQIEARTEPVVLTWAASRSTPDQSTMDQLKGNWRLIYSSAFNTGSLGGRRPGPPAALVPSTLGQIYQRIDDAQRLDNVVEFLFNYRLPQLPFMGSNSKPETPALRLTLRHDYEVVGSSTVRIVYEDTAVEALGTQLLDMLPKLSTPQLPDFLKPPRNFRSASFDVTFLDDMMRITRGDRGELRIYLRDYDMQSKAYVDYQD